MTAATPTEKTPFEIIPARQSPNEPDMISIAAGNDASTVSAQVTSLRPVVSESLPEPAIEYRGWRRS